MQTATAARKVEDIKLGNLVDLESCPFLAKKPIAQDVFGEVVFIDKESPACVVIGYEGIDQVGYPLGTELQVRLPREVPDPLIKVRPVGQSEEWVEWKLSQNLTDRWGDLNYHNEANKPLDGLLYDTELLEALREQMWDECTFIVRKDGQHGILFEIEFCSQESEAVDGKLDMSCKPHAVVVAAALAGMKKLADQFPGVLFAVPEECNIVEDRPAAWAFVPNGLLNAEERAALGMALLSL